jgi:hypothetical protein
MTQTELADLAGLGLSTVVDFEKERRQATAIQALQYALNHTGIEFIAENVGGSDVRLRKRQQKKG